MKTPRNQRNQASLGFERLEPRDLLAGLAENIVPGVSVKDVDSSELTVRIDAGQCGVVQPAEVRLDSSSDTDDEPRRKGLDTETEKVSQSGEAKVAAAGQPTVTFGAAKAAQFGEFNNAVPVDSSALPSQVHDEALQSLYPHPQDSVVDVPFDHFDPNGDATGFVPNPVLRHDPVGIASESNKLSAPLIEEGDGLAGQRLGSDDTRQSTGLGPSNKIKSPEVDPLAGETAAWQAKIDFSVGFDDSPESVAAYMFVGLIVRASAEVLPYKPIGELSNADLGRLAGALLWIRLHHRHNDTVDLIDHYVRLEIRSRFGRRFLPNY